MHALLADFRYAWRLLSRQRTFTAAAVATLAIAVAANTAIFSVVHGVLLRPLPLPEPGRVVRVEELHRAGRANLTGAAVADVVERARSFEAIASVRLRSAAYSTGAVPEQVDAAHVSPGYFAVLGLAPAAGRFFDDRDFGAGAAPSVVLAEGLWRRSLGADPSAVGRVVRVHGVPREVVGIMPASGFAPGDPDVWIPRTPGEALAQNRRAHLFFTIARLAGDATLESARAELAAVSRAIARDSSEDGDMQLVAAGLQSRLTEEARPALLLLWIAVAVLLLVGAANVANLLLMQGTARARELAIRAALGAGRRRLLSQLLLESVLLALAGGTLGTALGFWSVGSLGALLPGALAGSPPPDPGWWIAAFGLGLSLATAVFFGLVSALRLSRPQPAAALRARDAAAPSATPIRATLVASEVALTVVLLAAALLLGRSFLSVVRVDVGFDPANVVTFDVSLPSARYAGAAAHARFHERLLEGIREIPGVTAAAAAGALPFRGGASTTMEPAGGTGDPVSADVVNATPDFFAVLRIPLRRGRLYSAADRAGAEPVMVISQAAAQRLWPDGADPIGRTVTMRHWGDPYPARVVGVVGDVRQGGPEADIRPVVYYPLTQFPESTLRESVVIRTAGQAPHVLPAARELVRALDRDQPIAAARTMDEIVRLARADRRVHLVLVGLFAAAAALLAAIGVYGVVAFAIGQRTHEIGVRMALGARPSDVLRLTVAQAAVPVGAGASAGLIGAVLLARAFRGLLVGVEPADPATLFIVVSGIGLLAAAACIAPARRALGVDPATALRAD